MNLVNDGNIVQGVGDGTTLLKGSANTTTSGTGTLTIDRLEIAMDNGVSHTLASTVNIKNVITLTSGQLISGGFLTLKSDSLTTARVAPVTSAALPAISGNVIVERFIRGRRKYRLLTSSVTTSNLATLSAGQENLSIWGNWQNQGNNSTANNGTLITGGTAADGFDQQTQNVSMYTYDDVGRRYIGFSSGLGKNTKYTPLKAGIAYFIFVYGDRINSYSTSSPNNTIIKQTGTLLSGTQTYNTGSSIPLSNVPERYTLLGNPFASPIDWAQLTKSNIATTYWGWDPNLSTTGGYVTVNTVGNTIVISPLSGTTALNQFIQPGQGFFVKTTAASPSLIISEQHKTSNINNNAFRSTSVNDLPLIAVNLLYQYGSNTILADGTLAIFDQSFNNQTGAEDATKMIGNAESMSIQNGSELFSIYGSQMPVITDTIQLTATKLTRPQYKLQVFTQNLPSTITPYLADNYLQTTQQLSTTDSNLVSVNINFADSASFDPKRFKLVFQSSLVLPVNFTTVNAVKNGKQVIVEWKVANDAGMSKYEIEHSVNGIDFGKKGEIVAHQSLPGNAYQWTDIQPEAYNYYRVRAVQADTKFVYNKVVTMRMDLQAPSVSVYPNPIHNKTIQLKMKDVETGKYTVLIYDLNGKIVFKSILQHNKQVENESILMNSKIAAGSYLLNIKNTNESFHKMMIIK